MGTTARKFSIASVTLIFTALIACAFYFGTVRAKAANAEEAPVYKAEIDLSINGEEGGNTADFYSGVHYNRGAAQLINGVLCRGYSFVIYQAGSYRIFGNIKSSGIGNEIQINAPSGSVVTITLDNVTMDYPMFFGGGQPITVTNGNVTINLVGDSNLSAGETSGDGIRVDSGATLKITSEDKEGTLNVEGAVGIGNSTAGHGAVTIESGSVTAIGNLGAGVGGSGGAVTINGGYVEAIGTSYGAGIGGFNNNVGDTVEIRGGVVIAKGGKEGVGIGAGSSGVSVVSAGTLEISGGSVQIIDGENNVNPSRRAQPKSGGVNVYLVTLVFQLKSGFNASGSLVTGGYVDTAPLTSVYGVNDLRISEDRKLYLYIPSVTSNIMIETDEVAFYMSYAGTAERNMFVLNGSDGSDGKKGEDGVDGTNGHNGIDGVDGEKGLDGKDGEKGIDGKDGKNGKDGKDANAIAYTGLALGIAGFILGGVSLFFVLKKKKG